MTDPDNYDYVSVYIVMSLVDYYPLNLSRYGHWLN